MNDRDGYLRLDRKLANESYQNAPKRRMNPLKKAGLISFIMLLVLFLACYIPLKVSGLWDAGMNYRENVAKAEKLGILPIGGIDKLGRMASTETPLEKALVPATQKVVRDPELRKLFPGAVPPPVPTIKDRREIEEKFAPWVKMIGSARDSQVWTGRSFNFYFDWKNAQRMFYAFAHSDADKSSDSEIRDRMQTFLAAQGINRLASARVYDEDVLYDPYGLALAARWLEKSWKNPQVVEEISTIVKRYDEETLARRFLQSDLKFKLQQIKNVGAINVLSGFPGAKAPPKWQLEFLKIPFVSRALQSKCLEGAIAFHSRVQASGDLLGSYLPAYQKTYGGYDASTLIGFSMISFTSQLGEDSLTYSLSHYRGRNTLIRMLKAAINAAKDYNSTGKFPPTIPVDPSIATTETDGSPISYIVSPDGQSLEISVPKYYDQQVPVKGTTSTRKARMTWGYDLLGNPNRFVIKLGPEPK